MKLLKLYTAILGSLNAHVDKEGYISLVGDGETLPCTIDGKRLALPTRELLRRGSWDENNLQPFHPLSEHIARGESPVLKKLRLLIQIRLATVYERIILLLADLCSDSKKHKSMAPKSAAVLQVMPNADEKTFADLERILDNAMRDPSNVVRIYLRRGVMFDGIKTPRVCTIRFPLLEEFQNDEPVVHGVKLRKKDYAQIRALLEYITPDEDAIETYGGGSVSNVAPYFDALIRAYAKAAKHLNSLVWMYRKHIDDENDLLMDLDWVEDFEDLDKYRNDIPMLSGNEGELLTEESVGINRGAGIVEEESRRTSPRRNYAAVAAESSHTTRNAAPVTTGVATGAYNTDVQVAESARDPEPVKDVPSNSTFNVSAASEAMRRPTYSQVQPNVQYGASATDTGGKTFAQMQAERQRSFQASIPTTTYQPVNPAGNVPAGQFASNVRTPYQSGYQAMGNGMYSQQYGAPAPYQQQGFVPNYGQPPQFGQQQI